MNLCISKPSSEHVFTAGITAVESLRRGVYVIPLAGPLLDALCAAALELINVLEVRLLTSLLYMTVRHYGCRNWGDAGNSPRN